ncbi:hypothetical protein E2C01_030890 [Portunus trituberculatus]|uniref:Uncharacterized protein n=1 Tax=Portunus trituberculatus TaxID=210409 RepID=A0A5B7EX23_PORTR|nr:hypothetical protein [Portunus trituberculatus]
MSLDSSGEEGAACKFTVDKINDDDTTPARAAVMCVLQDSKTFENAWVNTTVMSASLSKL